MPDRYTNEELELLTPQEREGYLDTSVVDEGDPILGAPKNPDPVEPADKSDPVPKPAPKPVEPVPPVPADPVPPIQDGTEPAPAPVPAAEAPATEPAPSASPMPTAPVDHSTRLSSIVEEVDALDNQMDDGEITMREWRQQTRNLSNEETTLKDAQRATTQKANQEKTTFLDGAVAPFLAAHPMYATGSPAFQQLDAEVKRLQIEWNQNGRSHFDPVILDQAHANLAAIARGYGAEIDPAKDPVPAFNISQPALEPAPKIPPSLAHVPASAATAVDDGGRYARLDLLTGEAYESALARLSEADRDDYLQR